MAGGFWFDCLYFSFLLGDVVPLPNVNDLLSGRRRQKKLNVLYAFYDETSDLRTYKQRDVVPLVNEDASLLSARKHSE